MTLSVSNTTGSEYSFPPTYTLLHALRKVFILGKCTPAARHWRQTLLLLPQEVDDSVGVQYNKI
jgi:hypothetical protein